MGWGVGGPKVANLSALVKVRDAKNVVHIDFIQQCRDSL